MHAKEREYMCEVRAVHSAKKIYKNIDLPFHFKCAHILLIETRERPILEDKMHALTDKIRT